MSLTDGKCDRCKKEADRLTGSFFNTDMICTECTVAERAHPQFEHARSVENEEFHKGNMNFAGIGLPKDLEELKMKKCPRCGNKEFYAGQLILADEDSTKMAYTCVNCGFETDDLRKLSDEAPQETDWESMFVAQSAYAMRLREVLENVRDGMIFSDGVEVEDVLLEEPAGHRTKDKDMTAVSVWQNRFCEKDEQLTSALDIIEALRDGVRVDSIWADVRDLFEANGRSVE